jgi:hypothetical protein
MDCSICFEEYESSGDRKPYSIIPCGHPICLKCLNTLHERNCPDCRAPITGQTVNYGIMQMIDSQETFNKKNKKFKLSENVLLREFKGLSNRLSSLRESKTSAITSIKKEIERETQMKIEDLIASVTSESENLLMQCQELENRNEKFLLDKEKQINQLLIQSDLVDSVTKANSIQHQFEKVEQEIDLFEREMCTFLPISHETCNKIGRIDSVKPNSVVSDDEKKRAAGVNLERETRKYEAKTFLFYW